MTAAERARRDDHALERAVTQKVERHEAAIRERAARRVASLVGPGHNYSLAPDAPLDADPRYDHTGFCPGGRL